MNSLHTYYKQKTKPLKTTVYKKKRALRPQFLLYFVINSYKANSINIFLVIILLLTVIFSANFSKSSSRSSRPRTVFLIVLPEKVIPLNQTIFSIGHLLYLISFFKDLISSSEKLKSFTLASFSTTFIRTSSDFCPTTVGRFTAFLLTFF
uniref:Rep175 n=1 Tax=Bacillus thuringiensis subsp. tenebrionis TaxID=1444 RepID=Q2HYH6_BACTT|nr:Rep175 [Bacillus thuringiensis serovar tenebrionis]